MTHKLFLTGCSNSLEQVLNANSRMLLAIVTFQRIDSLRSKLQQVMESTKVMEFGWFIIYYSIGYQSVHFFKFLISVCHGVFLFLQPNNTFINQMQITKRLLPN